MRIWIDLINTPQVSFFLPFIEEYEKNNHQIVITCRDSSNTVELLKHYNLNFHIIGDKTAGWNKKRYFQFIKRVYQLYKFVKKQKINVAASQSSFYLPVVSKLLRIPALYTNDNEYAQGNIFGFLFATKVILPIALSEKEFTKKWPLTSKLSFYFSIKEAIYLSQQPELLKIFNKKTIIYFRPEPSTAQYYKGPVNFFDDNLIALANLYSVMILPRDKNQIAYYSDEKFAKLKVAEKPVGFDEILSDCLLFIGAGGSMSRELAIMGIKVISIYQDYTLCVDKYLVDQGRMTINPKIDFKEIQTVLGAASVDDLAYTELNAGKKSFTDIKALIYNMNSGQK